MQLCPVYSGLLQHFFSGFLCSPAHSNVRVAAQAGGKSSKIIISSKSKKINRWGVVKATLQCMRTQSPSGAGCYKMLAPSKTQESVGRRDRAPESSTLLVLCWQGLLAPLAVPCHCILSHRAGGLGCHSSRHHRPASALGWPGDHHRVGWRGVCGFSCARYCVCWVPGGLLCHEDPLVLSSHGYAGAGGTGLHSRAEQVSAAEDSEGYWNSGPGPQEDRLELASL